MGTARRTVRNGLKLLIWNIRHGGTNAVGIANAVTASGAHVAVLCEYHRPMVKVDANRDSRVDAKADADLASLLRAKGFGECLDSAPPPGTNGILVASRRPLSEGDVEHGPPGQEPRWLHVQIGRNGAGLDLGCAHVPVFKRGKKDEKSDKEKYWQWLMETEVLLRDRPCLLVGDWNTGLNTVDKAPKGARFHNWKDFRALEKDRGWRDTFRDCHGETREYSWWSSTGNGFRLDHCFLSPGFKGRLVRADYVDELRGHLLVAAPGRDARPGQALSDHAAMVVQLE